MVTKALFRMRIVIAAILVGVAVLAYGQYQSSVTRAKEASAKSQLWVLREAIDRYQADKGKNPESLAQLVAGGYLSAVHPGIGEADLKRLTGK